MPVGKAGNFWKLLWPASICKFDFKCGRDPGMILSFSDGDDELLCANSNAQTPLDPGQGVLDASGSCNVEQIERLVI